MPIDPTERDKKFFYANGLNAGMFDTTVDLVVPQYQLMHELMTELLKVNFGYSRSGSVEVEKVVLDVGSGTGGDSLALLKQFPSIRIVALDFSRPMCDVYRRRFSEVFPTGDINLRVRFVEGDIVGEDGCPSKLRSTLEDFTGGQKSSFDAVVSALTLHHLEKREKLEAYTRAFEVLRSGGLFLNGDLFSYEARLLTNFAKDFDMTWISDHFTERLREVRSSSKPLPLLPNTENDCERLNALWLKHYEEDNLLNSIEVQEQMLKFIGFRQTGVPFRYSQVGILWACK